MPGAVLCENYYDSIVTQQQRQNNSKILEPRILELKLDFLEQGIKYNAFLYEDAPETYYVNNWEACQTRKIMVDSKFILTVNLALGSGVAIRIEPVNL